MAKKEATIVVEQKEEESNESICGINQRGEICATRYNDPLVMARHQFRAHGIGDPAKLQKLAKQMGAAGR